MTLRASTLPLVGKTLTKFVTPDVSASKTAVQNWSALTAAADRCALLDASDGGKHVIWVPPGQYNMDASAGHTTSQMRLFAIPGTVRFIFAVGKPAIRVNQIAGAVGPVLLSAIAAAVHPDVSGIDTSAFTQRLTATTIGDVTAANFQRGDAIFVGGTNARTYYTNNVISYPVGSVNYIAESSSVEAISTASGYVYLASPLLLASLFTTGLYCYRLSRTGGPEIDGIDFDSASDPLTEIDTVGAGNYSVVDLVGVNRGYIRNCTFHRSYHAAIGLTSCSRVIIQNNKVLYAPTNGSTSYGYGVAMNAACYGCVVDSNYFEACRHGYTGDGLSTTSAFAQGSWYTYGDQRGCIVSNNKAVGCTGAAFDTHEPSIDTMFVNNVAVDTHRPSHGTAGAQSNLISNAANSAAYQIRGRADTIIGGASSGCQMGIVIMSPGIQHEPVAGEGSSPESKPGLITVSGFVIDGYMYNNLGNYAVDIWGNASITAANQVCVDINDIDIKHFPRGVNIRTGMLGRIQFTGGIIRAYDILLTLQAAANGDYAFFGTVFDQRMSRSGEQMMEAAATTAGTLHLINTVHRPNSTSNMITAATGCTLTVRHANVINANSAVTLTMVGGTGSGTVTKTALTALT